MGQDLEQKLKIESEVLAIKRELKYATDSLSRVKTDTQDIINTKERVTKEIGERNKELVEVLNDISNAKLTWALERQEQMDSLSQKHKEADEIIKTKSEIAVTLSEIKKVEEKNTDILNETRRLELKVKNDELLLKNREKELENGQKALEKREKTLENDKKEFKNKVLKVLEEAHNL